MKTIAILKLNKGWFNSRITRKFEDSIGYTLSSKNFKLLRDCRLSGKRSLKQSLGRFNSAEIDLSYVKVG